MPRIFIPAVKETQTKRRDKNGAGDLIPKHLTKKNR